MHEDRPTTGWKGRKQFRSKIWEHKEYNRKAQWTNNVKKELQWQEVIPVANISLESLRATLKKEFQGDPGKEPSPVTIDR